MHICAWRLGGQYLRHPFQVHRGNIQFYACEYIQYVCKCVSYCMYFEYKWSKHAPSFHTGWGDQSCCLLLKRMVALDSTDWCVLGFYLSICLMKAPFFVMTAPRWQQNEWQVLRIYSATSRSHSAEMDKRRVTKLAWGVFTSKTC